VIVKQDIYVILFTNLTSKMIFRFIISLSYVYIFKCGIVECPTLSRTTKYQSEQVKH